MPSLIALLVMAALPFEAIDIAAAQDDIDSVKPVTTSSALMLNDRGEDFRRKGDLANAMRDFTEAIRLDPRFTWPYNNRGLVWAAKGEFEEALKDYEEAIRIDPRYTFAFNNRGLVWTAKGEFEKAIKDFNEAIQLDPKYSFPFNNRGLAWELKGDLGKAIADFAEAIQLDPRYAAPHNSIAWLRATCHDPRFRGGKEAVEFAFKACELTDWKSYAELDSLAAAYAEAGDFTSAVIWALTALENAPAGEIPSATKRLELYRSGQPYHQSPKP